jgi:hypothetical protein
VRNNKAKESRKKEHTQESELENNKPTEWIDISVINLMKRKGVGMCY